MGLFWVGEERVGVAGLDKASFNIDTGKLARVAQGMSRKLCRKIYSLAFARATIYHSQLPNDLSRPYKIVTSEVK